MIYDVIVAGAGPAGSTAARECAARGMSVALLDRAEFPRDKPCGGGVNVRAARLLPFSIEEVVERPIYGMRLSVKQGDIYTRRSSDPITYLTQRRRLDEFLARQAAEAGANFMERRAVREVTRGATRIEVRAGNEAFAGRALVVADGANGPTARLAGIRVARSNGIAFEGNITPKGEYPRVWQDMFGIDVGDVPGGYGWLFPKGDHLNIGVGGHSAAGPSLRTRLDSLTRFYGFETTDFWGLRGHPLPVRCPGSPVADGDVVLVGDAAGFLDPLTGEGIYAAIWSGQQAARHLAQFVAGEAANLDAYANAVRLHLEVELSAASELYELFHASPPAWAQLVKRSSRAWQLVCALTVGDISYLGIKQRSRMLKVGIEAGASMLRTQRMVRRALKQRVRHPA